MSKEIINKLESANEPNRAIDYDIHAHTNPPLRDGFRYGNVPAYTASLDATIALAERMLPGWRWIVSDYPTGEVVKPTTGAEYVNWQADAASPAIALLIAIFKALESIDE